MVYQACKKCNYLCVLRFEYVIFLSYAYLLEYDFWRKIKKKFHNKSLNLNTSIHQNGCNLSLKIQSFNFWRLKRLQQKNLE